MRIEPSELLENKKYCESVFADFVSKKIVRKTETSTFERHIRKSIDNLDFANFVLREHDGEIKKFFGNKTFYDWCITIYYYAIYHTALALIAKAGYYSKNHLATIATLTLFYYHKNNVLSKEEIKFIIDKIKLDKEDIDFIINSKDVREEACYGVSKTFELAQAKTVQQQTVKFINKIRNLIY